MGARNSRRGWSSVFSRPDRANASTARSPRRKKSSTWIVEVIPTSARSAATAVAANRRPSWSGSMAIGRSEAITIVFSCGSGFGYQTWTCGKTDWMLLRMPRMSSTDCP